MPIVFVHGVNNRAGDEYRDSSLGVTSSCAKLWRRRLDCRPRMSPSKTHTGVMMVFSSPGGWLCCRTPMRATRGSAPRETSRPSVGPLNYVAKSTPIEGGVVERARTDFAETVDLLYGAALAGVTTPEDANALAKSFLRAVDYVNSKRDLAWLNTATDENFADLLNYHVHKHDDEESMGGGGLLDQLKEGLSRLVNAIPEAGTELLNRLARKKLNATVTRFAGDAFVYLATRGEPGKEGPIVAGVLKSLKKAEAAKTAKDNKLIVIAHSFGGEIIYDVLTRFWPELEVDCLISVGSQIGLFEEMKLYLASDAKIPAHYPDGKVPMPPKLKRWLNVFDMNDVLSYRVAPVFDGAQDFKYDGPKQRPETSFVCQEGCRTATITSKISPPAHCSLVRCFGWCRNSVTNCCFVLSVTVEPW